MREILFRAKRVDNGEWVEGFYYEKAAPLQCMGEKERGKSFIVFAGFADWNMPRPMYEVEVNPETVGQFTGLIDRNGKKIYEGDIIQLTNEDLKRIEVICEFGTAKREIYGNLVEITGFYFINSDGRKTFPIVKNYAGKHDLELFEVIRSVHDNPELTGNQNK